MAAVVSCLFSGVGYDACAQGVMGEARRLADKLGASLQTIIVGAPDPDLVSAVQRIADEVLIPEEPRLSTYNPDLCLVAMERLCKDAGTQAILLGNDIYSQELSPRLAHRLRGSAVGDVTAVIAAANSIRVHRSTYGGKAEAVVELKRTPAVLWLRGRAFAPAGLTDRTAPIKRIAVELPTKVRANLIERSSTAEGNQRLEDAKVIISGGRGLGGPAPFAELRDLAGMLGGQVGASRAACDAGWVAPSLQVGQTGRKVAPQLYLAVAIHGASQHMAGVSDAKVIAAINIDSDAPIFKYCSFGIVEDYRKVLPMLRARLSSSQ